MGGTALLMISVNGTKIILEGALIDIELDHTHHMDSLKKYGFGVSCKIHEPRMFFKKPDSNTYYDLYYTEDGSKLIRISSWDYIGSTYKKEKRKKYSADDCYWSKQVKDNEEFELVDVIDYTKPINNNHIIWWERKKTFWGSYK